MNTSLETLMIGWTTCNDEALARQLASEAVEKKLAGCAQVYGPVTSYYSWNDTLQNSLEWTLRLKFPARKLEELKAWIIERHPYKCPQWYAITANDTYSAYQEWIDHH